MPKNKVQWGFFLFFFIIVGSLISRMAYIHHADQKIKRTSASVTLPDEDYFLDTVKPILDQRCVVCHSCYNAPCQLKLTSYEGILRGASKSNVNDVRWNETSPTRLYVDAHGRYEWRNKGFFPVVFEGGDQGESDKWSRNLMNSLIYKMIAHNRGNKDIPSDMVKSIESNSCPLNAEFETYANARPEGGMPYGFPELTGFEFNKIQEWIGLGAPGPSLEKQRWLETPSKPDTVKKWENFFNQPGAKARLVSRYIYEHLFLSHIYFKEMPNEYFELVRTRTKFPLYPIEIPTKRPYSDPGKEEFSYRLRKVKETIMYKTHMLYELSDKKMQRYQELFYTGDWDAGNAAFNYDPAISSNPFIVFKNIPARSRYQFLLDNAFFYITSFTKGPVCKGSVALNVINDQAFAFFLNPDSDLSVTNPQFLEETATLLEHPAKGDDSSYYYNYKMKQMKYAKKRKEWYEKELKRGMRLEDIWDGDKVNPDAVLTIFRHDDSAHVARGALGGIPKTALVFDYPILERIYYSLVAGFNPFGGLTHQLSTRLYMDNLRTEGEDLFLSFLPPKKAKELRESWYQGTIAKAKMYVMNAYSGISEAPQIEYQTSNPKKEFILKVLDHYLEPKVRGPVDSINCCEAYEQKDKTISADPIHSVEELEREIKKVADVAAPYVQYFPEFSLLRVKMRGEKDLVYSITKNVDYANISFALPGDSMREHRPENETLFFLKGFQGSYPNFFFVVDFQNMQSFLKAIQALPPRAKKEDLERGKVLFKKFVTTYGVPRNRPDFWAYSDWFNQYFFKEYPVEAGVLDLNRYENVLEKVE